MMLAAFDVLQAIEDVFLTRDAELRRVAETNAEKNGVEILSKIFDWKIDADVLAGFELHAELLHEGNFHESDFDRLPQRNDAVSGKTSGQVTLFEKSDGVAELSEFPGTRESRRAGADDGYFFAGGRRRAEESEFSGISMIHRVTLEAPDCDGFVFGAKDTSPFTQFLNGADASAGGAEQVGFEYGARGPAKISGVDFLDEFGDVDVRGTGVCAGSVVAHQAARGFSDGLVLGEREEEFTKPGSKGNGVVQRNLRRDIHTTGSGFSVLRCRLYVSRNARQHRAMYKVKSERL